jgi:hypothetical protein
MGDGRAWLEQQPEGTQRRVLACLPMAQACLPSAQGTAAFEAW